MKHIYCILLALLVLAGCSTLGPMSAVSALTGGGGPSLDVEATLGDKTQTVDVGKKNTQEAESIVNNVQEIDPLLLMVAVLGWLLPGPGEIWRGLTNLLPWVRRKK